MELFRIPKMKKEEYDSLIRNGVVSRIAFRGSEYPYIAPFLYVFDGHHMYFLSTRYGRKVELFNADPRVSVEVERFSDDLSTYTFVTLQGTLRTVDDEAEKKRIRQAFIDRIGEKNLSRNVLAALGHKPGASTEEICTEERAFIWKLADVVDIVALKNE